MKRPILLLPALFVALLVPPGCTERPGGEERPEEGAAPAAAAVGPRDYRVALDRLEEGNLRGAMYALERTVREHPDFVEGWRRLGEVLRELAPAEPDYLERAAEVYDRLAALVPEDDPGLIEATARLDIMTGNLEQALATYEEVLARDPGNCRFWTLYGRAQVTQGGMILETEGPEAAYSMMEEALASFRKAIDLCPDNFEAYRGIAIILYQRKLYEDVVVLYEDLLEKYPEEVDLLREYAMAQFRSRHWEGAAESFTELENRDPRPEERLSHATALQKLGRHEEAEEQLAIYRETAPKLEGPWHRTREEVLREELGIREAAVRAMELVESGDYDGAIAVWAEKKKRLAPLLEDPELSEAAESIWVWIERRVQLARERKEGTGR